MKQPLFNGVCTALVTPFKDGKINYPLLDKLLDRQIRAGVRSVVLSGTTGESPTLSDIEKAELIFHTKQFTGNDCIVIAGSGTNSTEHTVVLSKEAEQAGADGLLTVSPYYNKGNPDGLYQHFCVVADSVKIPVILYNVPSRTGMDVPISVYDRLSGKTNIIGVKEATGDITKIAKIRSICDKDFYVWSGNDDQIVPTISLGGIGVISVLSNVYPEETVKMTQAALDGDYQLASHLQIKLMPLISALFSEVNPIPVKYALRVIGYDCGECRLPLGTLSPANMQALSELLL